MKGLVYTKPKTLVEKDILDTDTLDSLVKVKLTNSLINLNDVLHYNGEFGKENVALGSYGVGIVTQASSNLFGLEVGKHVYIDSKKPCLECYNCKSGDEKKCSDILTAGEDYDGFLRDFISIEPNKLFTLPETVSDIDALFIGYISRAISVVDKLGIQKGDYVAIIGANNFANILAQLLIYYQAVPIVLSDETNDLELIKNSGIYYTIGPDDNWAKEVATLTGGRMTNSVVYISDCEISPVKAFSVASYNAKIAFTGISNNNISVSFNQAVKKQLNIFCVSDNLDNPETSINLLANKAINVSSLKFGSVNYEEFPQKLEKLSTELNENKYNLETVVTIL